MAKFNEMLRYLRQRAGYSQQDLADILKISKSTIGMYEQGRRKPDFETLEKIADIFNVDMNFLIGNTKVNENTPDYYYDDEAMKAAEFLHKNPEYKVLMDASRKIRPEDIRFIAEMIDRMSGNNGDDTGV